MIESKNIYVNSFTFPKSPESDKPSIFVMVVSIGGKLIARYIQKGKAIEVPCVANESDETIYSRIFAKISGQGEASAAAAPTSEAVPA